MERPAHGKHVWMHDLMVEQNAVERPVNAVIDVIWGKLCELKSRLTEISLND